jgi:N6-adenosine-specific RNA methylase IME4
MRSAAEFFLTGTRGRPKSESRSERNLIVAPVREHSRKPEEAYEMLERMFPAQRRCELFARYERPGWAQWGKLKV